MCRGGTVAVVDQKRVKYGNEKTREDRFCHDMDSDVFITQLYV
jgi:hypothetical protein